MDMKKPEILLVTRPLTPPWDEASKNFAIELAKELTDCKFHILTGKTEKYLPGNITQHEIYRGAGWKSFIQKSRLVLKLRGIFKRNPGIKIVHFIFTLTPFNSKILKVLTKDFKGRIIYTACILQRKTSLKSLIFVDQIVAYSQYSASELKVTQKPIKIIPPFLNFNDFPLLNEDERRKIRGKWGIKSYEKLILYPGEYARLKAVSTLWEGFRKILKTQPNSYLFMACRPKTKLDVKEEEKFTNEAHKTGLGSRVRFLGTVEDMAHLYSAADLTVFPVSSMKGKFDFPFVLLESLACGTPIITSDVAPLPEIWEGNNEFKKQFTFKAGDVGWFVKKSLEVLSNDRQEYTKKLSEFIRKRFNKKDVLENYRLIYEKILKGK